MLTAQYLNEISEEIGLQYERLQTRILLDIQSRFMKLQKFDDIDIWQVQKLREVGMLKTKTLSELIKITGKTQKALKKAFKEAGIESITNDNKLSGVELPAKLAPKQMRILEAGLKKVNATIKNMTGITLNDTLGTFERIATEGYNMVSSGAFTLEQSSLIVGKNLASKNLDGVVYKSGRRNSLEGAVERALRTGFNQTMINLTLSNAEVLGTNLVEVTAHEGARPEHALWQGKVFSIEGGTKEYPNLAEATGYGTVRGLGGANCRHNFFPYIKDVSEKAYSKPELKDLKDDKVKWLDEDMSFYDATQVMRKYEREVRALKKEALFTHLSNEREIKSKIKLIKKLSEATGVKKDFSRLIIY